MLRCCFGLLESFAEVLWIDFRFLRTYFRLLETDFRFLETSGTEFWLPGVNFGLWETSGRMDLASGSLWEDGFGLLEPFGRVLEAGFGFWRPLGPGFGFWRPLGPGFGFWKPLGPGFGFLEPFGRVLEAVLPSGGSWRPDLASGRVLEARFGVWEGPGGWIWGLGGSWRLDLGSETLLGPLFGGFLRVFLWNGDQI